MIKCISAILCPILLLSAISALFSCKATAATASKDDQSFIVCEWMWGSTIADAGVDGAEKLMSRCAEMGVTDVYLLVKGTGGTLAYLKTKYTENLSRKERDVLDEAIKAAHAHGIRLHAWICNMEDAKYKSEHPDAGMWHYIRARDNNRINLYDEGYLSYMCDVAKERAAYDIDGLHFDYIRYNHLANGWGENDFEALKAMGANIDRVKELVETTFGYNGRTAKSNYIFDAYNDGDPDALLIGKYRTGNVKNYAETIISAARSVKPDLIISAATMPEGAYNSTYADLHYGQNYEDAAELYDYICPMAYSTSYGQNATWVSSIAKNAINKGNKVVMGLQAFEGVASSKLMSEVNIMKSLLNDEKYKDSALGVVMFRSATFGYAKVTYDDTKKIIVVKVLNTSLSNAYSEVHITMQGGLKITGVTFDGNTKSSIKTYVPTQKNYVRLTGGSVVPKLSEAYVYLSYEGTIDPSIAPVTVRTATASDVTVYNTYISAEDPNEDMGRVDSLGISSLDEPTSAPETTPTPETTVDTNEYSDAPVTSDSDVIEAHEPKVSLLPYAIGIGAAVVAVATAVVFIVRRKRQIK